MGWILPRRAGTGRRTGRDEAVMAFSRAVNEVIEAEVAAAAEARLGGREGSEGLENSGFRDRDRGAVRPPSGGGPPRRGRPLPSTHPATRPGSNIGHGNDVRSHHVPHEIEIHVRSRNLAHRIQYLLPDGRRARIRERQELCGGETGSGGRVTWTHPNDPAQVVTVTTGRVLHLLRDREGARTRSSGLRIQQAFAASGSPSRGIPGRYLEGKRARECWEAATMGTDEKLAILDERLRTSTRSSRR